MNMSHMTPSINDAPPIQWSENLRSGIWPKPLVFWAVVFYIGLFILRPWEILFPQLGAIRFELLAVAVVSGFVFLKRGPLVKLSAQNITMLGLFGAVCLSGRNAWDPTLSQEEIVEFFGFVLIFFFIQKAVQTSYQSLFIVASYLMLTTLYVGKSMWEFAFNGAADYMMGVWRLTGIDHTYGHPNTMATSMLVSLPFAIYFYQVRHQFCQTWPSRWRQLFPWVLKFHIAACLLGIVLTQSRSAVVGLVFFAGIIVLRQRGVMKKMKWCLLALVVFVIGFSLAPTDTQNRIRTLWDSSIESRTNQGGAQKSAVGRWEGLLAGMEIYRRFPTTGVGIGNFAEYRFLHVDQEKLDAHNLPGEVLGELGTVGGIAFMAFFLAHVFSLRKLKKLGQEHLEFSGNDIYLRLHRALIDGLLLLLFSGLSGHNLQQYQWYFFAGFAITCIRFLKLEVSSFQQQELTNEEYADEATELPLPSGIFVGADRDSNPYIAPTQT